MKHHAVAVYTILAIFAVTAQAIPTSWTGAVTPAGAPASLVEGQFESATEIRLIWEQQEVTLAEDLLVNLSQPGDYDRFTFDSTPAVIVAGTMVSSYLLHFDPLEYTLTTLLGSVTFDNRILGVMVLNPELNASDPVLGAVGTTYPTYSPLSGSDLLTLTLTMNSLSLQVVGDYHVDHVRIITSVPDFTNTILLLGCALFGLGGTGWYVKKRKG